MLVVSAFQVTNNHHNHSEKEHENADSVHAVHESHAGIGFIAMAAEEGA